MYVRVSNAVEVYVEVKIDRTCLVAGFVWWWWSDWWRGARRWWGARRRGAEAEMVGEGVFFGGHLN